MTHCNKLGIADGDFHLFQKGLSKETNTIFKALRFALHKGGDDLVTVKDLNIISETIYRK